MMNVSVTWFAQTIQTLMVLSCFIQTMSSKSPVRFLSYSKETDDPQKVIENEKAYLKKAYNTYVESVKFHNDMVESMKMNLSLIN